MAVCPAIFRPCRGFGHFTRGPVADADRLVRLSLRDNHAAPQPPRPFHRACWEVEADYRQITFTRRGVFRRCSRGEDDLTVPSFTICSYFLLKSFLSKPIHAIEDSSLYKNRNPSFPLVPHRPADSMSD